MKTFDELIHDGVPMPSRGRIAHLIDTQQFVSGWQENLWCRTVFLYRQPVLRVFDMEIQGARHAVVAVVEEHADLWQQYRYQESARLAYITPISLKPLSTDDRNFRQKLNNDIHNATCVIQTCSYLRAVASDNPNNLASWIWDEDAIYVISHGRYNTVEQFVDLIDTESETP